MVRRKSPLFQFGRVGRPRALSPKQENDLVRMIVGELKPSKQVSLAMLVWNLRLVQSVVREQFGVEVHKATLSRLLNQRGLLPARAIRSEELICWGE